MPAPRMQSAIKGATDDTLRNNSTTCVYVTCKLPLGLLCELDIGKEKHRYVKLAGTRSTIMGQAAITKAPADFMEQWLKRNQHLPFVKKGPDGVEPLIRVHADEASAWAYASDTRMQKHGLEPLTQRDIPTDPTTGEKQIEIDVEHLRKMGINNIKAA